MPGQPILRYAATALSGLRQAMTISVHVRARIFAASRQEFLETGFRDTRMDGVAERTQVSKRTVYNHFSSKQAVFSAIVHPFIENMQRAATVEYDSERPLD